MFGAGGMGGGDVVPGGAVVADFEDVLGEHALGFADGALHQALPTEQEAEVRLSIAVTRVLITACRRWSSPCTCPLGTCKGLLREPREFTKNEGSVAVGWPPVPGTRRPHQPDVPLGRTRRGCMWPDVAVDLRSLALR